MAVKMLSCSDDLQLQQILVEINLLKSLSFDRNVVQFYGACLQPQFPMLVLVCCPTPLSSAHALQLSLDQPHLGRMDARRRSTLPPDKCGRAEHWRSLCCS